MERRQAIEAIRFLNQPLLAVQVRELRQAYKDFQRKGDIKAFLAAVEDLRKRFGGEQTPHGGAGATTGNRLTREDLRLICFDLI